MNKRFIFQIIFSFLFILILLMDLGNVDAPRQGTEGFYLQVAKETYLNDSWMTPIHMGTPHWSKPPFQFWLAFPFYAFSGGTGLFASRLSLLIFSLVFAFLIDRWCQRQLNSKPLYFFIFFCGTVGFLKYSRIYMMEMPLALLSTYAVLKYYEFYKRLDNTDLVKSAFWLGLSNLVKGPVSFVMGFGGIGIFHGIQWLRSKEKVKLNYLALWVVLSIGIGSFWYILSYISHGEEFFNYFFLRENVGKFTAKSYPIRVLFQGLFIFALPWSLFVPFMFKKLKTNILTDKTLLFLVVNFAFFFILWMIPSQRSHHYAMPSIPLLLIITFQLCFNGNENYVFSKIPLRLLAGIFGLLSLIVIFSFKFQEVMNNFESLGRAISTLFILAYGIFILLARKDYIRKIFIINYFCFTFVWIIFTPSFFLPTVPGRIITAVESKEVSVLFRKPFFIAEALQRDINIYNPQEAKTRAADPHSGFFIIEERWFDHLSLGKHLVIKDKWPIWKRGTKAKDIFKSISNGNLTNLQESLLLLAPK
ncbi:MAG: hypothetical protein KC493_08820 [Bacteriovoracaceae bacterium]|nr:hypothetical protein [Bacteriovoracaceae bacterium]